MNKSQKEMLMMVMGDASLVSQMLDAGALSESEMRDITMRVTEKLGRTNINPERFMRAFRNVKVA